MKILVFVITELLILTSYGLSAEEGMPQLNPEFWPSQIFWLLVTFSILYLVIWKFIIPKIANNLENRKAKIVDDLNEAQKLKEDAEKKLSEYEKIISNSKKEADKVIFESKIKLEKNINDKRKKIEKEIENEIMLTEKKIHDFKKSSLNSIEEIATQISTELTNHILNTKVNSSNVSAVVKDISKKNLEKLL